MIGANVLLSQLILDSSPLAITVLDDKLDFIDCNEAALRLFGASSKKEFLDDYFRYSAPIQPNGMFAGDLARDLVRTACEAGSITAEWLHRNSGGELIPCEAILKRIDYDETYNYGDKYIIIKYDRDLRAEIEAQAEVTEITERNKIMIDVTPICFVFFDDRFNIVDCNPAALSLFGIPTINSFTDNFFKLSPEYQKDGSLSSESYITNMQRAFNDGYFVFEWDHLTVSGQALPVEVIFVRVEYQGSYRIAGYFRDLREHREMLAEMQRSEQKLREAKELAEESARIKTEFLANISHEIRTPLNAVLGISEVQLQGMDLAPDIKEAFIRIFNSGDLLLGIISDLLDMSKIEAEGLELTPTRYHVASLINDTAFLNLVKYEEKPIEFIVAVDENVPSALVGDELRIKQILNNILSNAFKYTHAGEVMLSVTAEDKDNGSATELRFSIRDTGQGMSPEQLEKLFDEYSRFNMETNRTIEGTGLGMSITQKLINLMDGEITVESEPGAGTLFTLRIPQVKVDDEVLGKETAENLRQFRSVHTGHRKKNQITREPMPYGSVLIVDDVETNLYVAEGLMKLYGLQTDTAASGRQAIGKITDGKIYDIIFMDHMMPEMDGIETAAHLRALGYAAPIVALTANAVAGQADIFLQNGFDDFISKPIDVRRLNAVLNRLVRDKQPPEIIEAARRHTSAENTETEDFDDFTEAAGKIDGIDTEIGLERVSGMKNMYKDTLFMVNKHILSDCGAMAVSLESGDIKSFSITVHAIKSLLATIGAQKLSDEAFELENAAKKQDILFCTERFPVFKEKLLLLHEQLSALFPDNTEESRTEKTSGDSEFLRENIQKALDASEDFDSDTAVEIIEYLLRFDFGAVNDLLENAKDAFDNFNYDEAAEILQEILFK